MPFPLENRMIAAIRCMRADRHFDTLGFSIAIFSDDPQAWTACPGLPLRSLASDQTDCLNFVPNSGLHKGNGLLLFNDSCHIGGILISIGNTHHIQAVSTAGLVGNDLDVHHG